MATLHPSILVAAGVLLAAAPSANAQAVPLPEAPRPQSTWVSVAGSLFDMQGFHGGDDGAYWDVGDGVQLRGTVERALRRDLAVGLAAGVARLPLTVGGGSCNGCQGDVTAWQTMGTLRIGGGGNIGFHSVFEVAAGVTGFTNITRDEDRSSVPGVPTRAERSIAPSIAAGYGIGYTLSPGLELSLVQEIGIVVYGPASTAPSGASSTPRFQNTRLGLRYRLGL